MIGVYIMYTDSDGSAAARRILGHALSRDHGVTDAELAKDSCGKPYLTGHPQIHVSISHTDGVVAVAVGDCPVGVDVQAVGKARMRVAERLFTSAEREHAGGDPLRFSEIWVRKESYAKLGGSGITRELSQVDTLTGENTGGAVFVPISVRGAAGCVCSFAEREITVYELEETDL